MDEMQRISREIYNQIGGHRFVVMTGCSDFYTIRNGLSMKIPRNKSNANKLEIVLNDKDLYNVSFYKNTLPNIKNNFLGKKILVKEFSDIYCDQLENIFESVTGLYTKL